MDAVGGLRGGLPLPETAAALSPRSKVWLERNGQVVLSAWRVELLEAVAETGSLTRAAERLGVPYRTAWYKLKDVETRLGLKLVQSQSGGAEGGGSLLTDEGRALVERFRRVNAGIAELVEQRFRAEFDELLS